MKAFPPDMIRSQKCSKDFHSSGGEDRRERTVDAEGRQRWISLDGPWLILADL